MFRRLFYQLLALGLVALFDVPVRAQQTMLTNPILAGYYPDPSIVKAGADYYLINSTFSYFPGLPVFHSRDLEHWKQVGNVIDRPSQVNFLGLRMSSGLFAPSISYHNGLFYVVCTVVGRGGNFVVTAKNPAGPWSDPVYLPKVHGIDPSLFFDGDRAYIVFNSDPPDNKPLYNGHHTIRQLDFDPVTLQTTGEDRILVNGGSDINKKPVWIEGPHMLKRGKYYYVYAAEGGTETNHSEVVFRSESPIGPFVPYERNPILTQRELPPDRANPITSTGHAQLVEGPDGRTYAVFLGVRPYEGNYFNTGRETFIAPVAWSEDWPIVSPDNPVIQYHYTAPFKAVKQTDGLPMNGNFGYTLSFKDKLDLSLLFLRTNDTTAWHISKKQGLSLKLKPETLYDLGNPSFIGKRQQHQYCMVSTEISFEAKTDTEKAGLNVYQNENHFYFLAKSIKAGKPVLQLFKSIATRGSKNMELLAEVPLDNAVKAVGLRIDARGPFYDFYYAEKPGEWQPVKKDLDAKFLSTQTAGGFIGCVFGLYATSSGTASTNQAAFKYLSYSGDDPVYRKQ